MFPVGLLAVRFFHIDPAAGICRMRSQIDPFTVTYPDPFLAEILYDAGFRKPVNSENDSTDIRSHTESRHDLFTVTVQTCPSG